MSSDEKTGYALQTGEGALIYFRGTTMAVKVSGESSEGAYSLIEMLHPPDVGPALHIHPTGAEAFYVLEGQYRVRYGDKIYTANPGGFVFIPKGVPHNYHAGPKGGKVLVLAPAGLENYFAKVADALRVGPVTWELEREVAKTHGQEFLDHLQHWGQ